MLILVDRALSLSLASYLIALLEISVPFVLFSVSENGFHLLTLKMIRKLTYQSKDVEAHQFSLY
jgi:hypothetical protein